MDRGTKQSPPRMAWQRGVETATSSDADSAHVTFVDDTAQVTLRHAKMPAGGPASQLGRQARGDRATASTPILMPDPHRRIRAGQMRPPSPQATLESWQHHRSPSTHLPRPAPGP